MCSRNNEKESRNFPKFINYFIIKGLKEGEREGKRERDA